MRKIFFLGLVMVACQQPKRNVAVSKVSIDSFRRHMNDKVQDYRNSDLWDSAKEYLNSLEDTVRQLNHVRLTFHWRLQKAQQLLSEYRFDSASVYMKKALSLLPNKNLNYKDSFDSYMVYQHLLMEQNLYDSALRIGNEAYYLTRNDPYRAGNICIALAKMYATVGDLQNSSKYMFKAWELKDKVPQLIPGVAPLILNYYGHRNNMDSVVYYLKIMQGYPTMYAGEAASLYEATGLMLVKRGRLEEGLQNQMRAKKILDSVGIKSGKFYNNLADTYNLLGQYGKAFMYIDSAIGLAAEEHDYNLLSLAWRTKSEIFLKNMQYRTAYAALDSSYTYSIEDADSSLRKYARELETKYAVREKDNAIHSLALANEASLKIRNQQRIIIITIAIAAAFITFVGVLLWRRKGIQMTLRETSLKQQLLRAQMDPHFIFNSLSLLQNLIRTGVTEKAIGYLNNLARLIRFNFENASENSVLLKNEIDALESYLKVQELYHPESFTYQINIYDGIEEDELYIPPMLLQPCVENAIEHGFSQINYTGMLTITIEKKEYVLQCMIEDNGKGIQNVSGINGIHSTDINQERLSILAKQTGVPARLTVTDKKMNHEGTGTRIRMEIPFRKNRRKWNDERSKSQIA